MHKDTKLNVRLSNNQFGIILILPALAVFLTVILYPFLKSLTLSFTDRSLLSPDYHFIAF